MMLRHGILYMMIRTGPGTLYRRWISRDMRDAGPDLSVYHTFSFFTAKETICYAPEEYSVLLDGEERARSTLNVLTIDGLQPDSDYTLSLRTEDGEETQSFHTEAESVLLDVRSFGAHGDGETDDTIYLQAAISACPKDGTVYVPAGTYLSRPLFLKSYMSLWLDEGRSGPESLSADAGYDEDDGWNVRV